MQCVPTERGWLGAGNGGLDYWADSHDPFDDGKFLTVDSLRGREGNEGKILRQDGNE